MGGALVLFREQQVVAFHTLMYMHAVFVYYKYKAQPSRPIRSWYIINKVK